VAPPFRIQAYTKASRIEIVSMVRDSILSLGASITDFQQFSNASVCLTIELPFHHLPVLYKTLSALPVSLSPEIGELIHGLQIDPSVSASTIVAGTLAISFLHHEPDLHIPIPAVPG
jgi:hypothetical protein